MIEVFTDFLNCHHADNREEFLVTRDHYNEENDPPRVLLDAWISGYETRIIHLYAHPYHDEGGPNILTGFFRQWDDDWELEELLQNFDTDYSIILHNRARTDAWPESAREATE
jgi:hypothetical protein